MDPGILSVGMVSALGLDWETSCAASRCGISRAGTLQHFRLQAGDPWEVEFVMGHQVDLLTRGFERQGRLLRLLVGVLRDLRRGLPDAVRGCGSIPVYLSLPDPYRTLGNLETILDEEIREETRARAAHGLPSEVLWDEAQLLLARATALVQWPGLIHLAAVSNSGHTGTMDVLERCLIDMSAGHARYAIVGAVDSLLDDETLAWLTNTGRLKNPALAAGLVPGEAGALFLLGCGQQERARLGTLGPLAFDREDHPFESGHAPLGRGLSRVVRQIADGADWPGQDPPWMLSDHNGETYRASDWGWALQRLVTANPIFSGARIWFPTICFGDTGSAGAAVGIVAALAAWKRGYAPSGRCCILACSDAGRRAALLVSSPKVMEACCDV